MSELYYTDRDRRKFSAQRAAATRKSNRDREELRKAENKKAREEWLKKDAIERPLREKWKSENKAKWLKYWRGRVCEAIDTSNATLAAHRIDSVVFEIAQWGGYAGFSTPFVDETFPNAIYVLAAWEKEAK